MSEIQSKDSVVPAEKGSVDTHNTETGKRLSRTRATTPHQTNDNNDKEMSDEATLSPSSQTESGAEEATGPDNTDKVAAEENQRPSNNRLVSIIPPVFFVVRLANFHFQRQVRQATKEKLSPACANCKRAKTRCTHRHVISVDGASGPSKKRKRGAAADAQVGDRDVADNDNDASAAVGAENQTPPPAKRPRRIQLKTSSNNKGEARSESIPPPAAGTVGVSSKQARGGTLRKRKFSEVEEEATPEASSSAAAAADDAGAGTVEETESSTESPPQKRSKRGRKPNKERVPVPAVEETGRRLTAGAPAAAGGTASNAAPGSRVFPPFPADNLQGAIQLSRHTALSRELQQRLADCETKWRAAIDSLESAKALLDSWVEAWQNGQ